MKCILWSENIYKNNWEEQDYIVILQIYLLINLLNHRVKIVFRERVFNLTASVVGNVTINRTGTFRRPPRLFLPRGSGKGSPVTALQKNKATSINHGHLFLMILAHLVVLLLCSWVLTYGYIPVFYSVSNPPKVVH